MRLKRLVIIAILGAVALSAIAGERHFTRNDSQFIEAASIELDSGDPARRAVGSLRYLGGWALKSHNGEFGGFSALTRMADGRFLAISDSGQMAGFRLIEGPDGAQIADSFIAPLPGATGIGDDGEEIDYQDRDSESITSNPERTQFWIGYENKGAVRRFGADFTRVSAIVRPKEMEKWPSNGGVEALVRLSDGRFILFAEAAELDSGGTEALIFSGDPTEAGVRIDRFAYVAPAGYRVTDAAELPDGRLLLLHRKFAFPSGFTAKLGIAETAGIAPGARLSSRVIASFSPPLTVDNMEAVLVEREQGLTVVWLMSDDNHMVLQRTLLLKFALDDGQSSLSPDGGARPGFSMQ